MKIDGRTSLILESKSGVNLADMGRKVFKIKNEPMTRWAWWWWFWLFFFNNPANPEKPRQLMITWSTKNVREFDCNNLKIRFNQSRDMSDLDGIVAAWYFDGEKMHHNFLLEQCNLNISDKSLTTDSTIPTSFSINKTGSIIKIGNDFKFIAELKNKDSFIMRSYQKHAYVCDRGYSVTRLNHLDLRGKIRDELIHGSAYFDRVFLNIPPPKWDWGVLHFENGSVMNYYIIYLLGKSIRKYLSFFDGNKMHEFIDISVKTSGGKMPTFIMSGDNEHEKINFTVKSYSHSSWTFRKKTLGIIPNKLTYNEYPVVISDLKLTNKKTGKKITLKELGRSVGNAEHMTGFLL